MSLHKRLTQLDHFLVESKAFWLPHPFKTERPEWCAENPELTQTLLSLDESSLAFYAANNDALITFIADYLPQLSAIGSLIDLPIVKRKYTSAIDSHLNTGVPGRKWNRLDHCIKQWKTLSAALSNGVAAKDIWGVC